MLSYLKTLSPIAKLSIKDLTYKHNKPGRHLQDLKFKSYAPHRRLCIYTYLQKYLAVTKPLQGDETKLLVSFNKPYQAVSRDTIRTWNTQVQFRY